MKRLLFTFAMMAAFAAMADNYFTAGENDTVAIAAADRGQIVAIPIRAHFDGRLDHWQLYFHPAEGTQYIKSDPGEAMTLYYTNANNQMASYSAQLGYGTHPGDSILISCSIPWSVRGYWDYNHDGVLESYGTVKWEAGEHDPMFIVYMSIDNDFSGGMIIMSGVLYSSNDTRGGTIDGFVNFRRELTVIVTFERGDVNGDGEVNISDVTALIDYLLTDTQPDTDGQFNAADVDGNGHLSIGDVTDLINILLTQ